MRVDDEILRLSGYEEESIVGSPLGLIYDRSDLATLIAKLPYVASRSGPCYMDRALLRNGGVRRMCHWTIRATPGEGDQPGYFSLTVQEILPSPIRESQAPAPQPPLALSPQVETSSPQAEAIPSPEALSPTPEEAVKTEEGMEACRGETLSLAVAGVAHDFKNALQTIMMNLDMASAVTVPGGKAAAYISEAKLALGDAETLARQMLAFTREEPAQRKAIRLDQLLLRVTKLCFAGSEIRCSCQIDRDLRCVMADPNQIYQVLHNIVINACQSMPTGGMVNIVAANADLLSNNRYDMPEGRYVVISIRDRGCGIRAENLPKIFEQNFTTKANGNGVGLASCRAIIDAHGGAIRVASKVGVGTEFLIFLPSSDVQAASETELPVVEHIATPPPRRAAVGEGRILVVEDQQNVARATLGILKQLGYEGHHAKNGAEALMIYREQLYSAEPIDLVLLDMTLPGGLPGEEVARELHQLDPHVRIIATSGYFEKGFELPNRERYTAVLPKPFGLETLGETIEAAITT